MSARPDLAALPALPRDDNGPVFREPWEARAFALVVRLHETGLFAWSEWARMLSEEIAKAERAGSPGLGSSYYQHWLAALERMASEKGLASPALLDREAQALIASAEHDHDHDHEPPAPA